MLSEKDLIYFGALLFMCNCKYSNYDIAIDSAKTLYDKVFSDKELNSDEKMILE